MLNCKYLTTIKRIETTQKANLESIRLLVKTLIELIVGKNVGEEKKFQQKFSLLRVGPFLCSIISLGSALGGWCSVVVFCIHN